MTFVAPIPPATPERPKWLSLGAVGVISVAALAVLAGATAPIGVLVSHYSPFAGMPGTTPELARMLALQQQVLSGPALRLSLVVGTVNLVAGAWALYSAIRVLSAKPGARLPFRRSVMALVVTENASLLAGVWLQSQNWEVLSEFAKSFALPSAGAAPPGLETTMRAFLQGAAVLGMVMVVGWGIVKLAVLVWAHRYAGTRAVVEYLDR